MSYNKINLELLEKPFQEEEVKQRNTDYGKILDYLETPSIIKRLNQAFAGEWSFQVLDHKILDKEVIALGSLRCGYITKQQFGTCKIHNNGKPEEKTLGDDLKAAASDALKKCATMFGVGLYLYNNGNKKLEELKPEEEKPDETAEELPFDDKDQPEKTEELLPFDIEEDQPFEEKEQDKSEDEEEKKVAKWQKIQIYKLIKEKGLSKEFLYQSIQKKFNKKLYDLTYSEAKELIQKLKEYKTT